ncbi:MAG: SDR family oxidoreductase [Lentisphaeria bacterium]|nr:SDR family oxidoreductase [Lentisphaeria bacterium]
MRSMENTRVLITGAGVRIGRATASAFAKAGARVVIHYNSSEAEAHSLLGELATISPGHECVKADLMQAAERGKLIASLVADGRALNCLVNNASVYRRCPLTHVIAESLRADYEINFVAPFLLMRDFARYCEEGNIINLLDQRVATVDPSASTYGFAKKSLRDATEAAAVQWAPRIRVNAVAPGVVLPPPGADPAKIERIIRLIPMARNSAEEEIAEACLFLARAETITGQVLYVDGGLHLVGPDLAEPDHADYSL